MGLYKFLFYSFWFVTSIHVYLSFSINLFSYENASWRLEKIKNMVIEIAKIIKMTIENTVDKSPNNNFKKFIC